MASEMKHENHPLLLSAPSVNSDSSLAKPHRPPTDGLPQPYTERWYFPRRWILMLLISMGGMVSYMLRINTSITVIPMANDYHWSSPQQGAVLSSLFFGYATTQLLWGWIARRLHAAKWVTGIGNSVAVLLTMLIPSVAFSFPLIVVTRILIGIAEAPFFPCVTQLLSSWIPPQEMATAVTVSYNGTLLGTVIVFFCTPLIIKYMSWQISFYMYSIVGFAWVCMWSTLIAETPTECKFIFWEEKDYIMSKLDKGNAQASEAAPRIPWRVVLTCRAVWALSLMNFFCNWGFYLLLSWTPTYLHRVHGLSLSSIGFASTLAYAGSASLSVLCALLCDRLLLNGWNKSLVRKAFPILSWLISAACLCLLCFYPQVTPLSATVCLVVCIVAQGISTPGCAPAPMDISSRLAGVVQGITNSAANLPGLFAVYITGLMVPHWTAVWVLCLSFYIAAALVFGILYEPVKVLD